MNDLGQVFMVAAFAGNFLLYAGLGMGAIPQGPRKIEIAFREGVCVAAVVLFTAGIFWIIRSWASVQGWDLGVLGVALCLIISHLAAKGVTKFLNLPYRPSVVSCAWAVSLIITREEMLLAETCVYALGAGTGVGLVWILASGILERLDLAGAPKGIQRISIFFISLGILSLILRGFQGLIQ